MTKSKDKTLLDSPSVNESDARKKRTQRYNEKLGVDVRHRRLADDTMSELKEHNRSRLSDIPNEFFEKHTWELWIIFILKLMTSLVFLIDDLTFLVFCEYEFGMT